MITKKKKTDENEKEKGIACYSKKQEPKQNELPLKSIVVYHDMNQNRVMELNKGCPIIKTKKTSYIFFNPRFLHPTSLKV